MDVDPVAAVRSFNRAVTQRVGALNEDYLARARPLGASRVLWEIGEAGVDARTIRSRLGLDSGYLSRLLRRLEGERLVALEQRPDDRRVRLVRLTDAGRVERAKLDRLSDALARSLLDPLAPRQRAELVQAMATVERLLTAGLIQVEAEDPDGEAARRCLQSYFSELDSRFDTGFDPAASMSAAADELAAPRGVFLIARRNGEPVGCGALKFRGDGPSELKRMWVAASARGLGIGRRLLRELEDRAVEAGAGAVRLETNQGLVEAIGLYRSAGYREVPAFNEEPYAHHWFEKVLTESQSCTAATPNI